MLKLLFIKKNHLFFTIAVVCCLGVSPSIVAQEQIGLIGGGSAVGLASRSAQGNTVNTGGVRLRYHGGLSYFSSDQTDAWGFRALLLYSNKGQGAGNRSTGRNDTHLHYVNLALELAYEVMDDVYIYAGLEPGVLVNAQQRFDQTNNPNSTRGKGVTNISHQYNFYDLSASLGAEYRFESGFFTSFRYAYGLVNIMSADSDPDTATGVAGRFFNTRASYLSIGYYF